VHRRDLILQLGIADDDPLVPERVLAPFELGAAVGRDRVQQLVDVGLCARGGAARPRARESGRPLDRLRLL